MVAVGENVGEVVGADPVGCMGGVVSSGGMGLGTNVGN